MQLAFSLSKGQAVLLVLQGQHLKTMMNLKLLLTMRSKIRLETCVLVAFRGCCTYTHFHLEEVENMVGNLCSGAVHGCCTCIREESLGWSRVSLCASGVASGVELAAAAEDFAALKVDSADLG